VLSGTHNRITRELLVSFSMRPWKADAKGLKLVRLIRVRISSGRAATGRPTPRAHPIARTHHSAATQGKPSSTHPIISSCNIFGSSRLWLEPGRHKSLRLEGSLTRVAPPLTGCRFRHVMSYEIMAPNSVRACGAHARVHTTPSLAPITRPPPSDQPVVFAFVFLLCCLPMGKKNTRGVDSTLALPADCSSLRYIVFRVFNGG
jgi:hypothetical protein